MGPIDYMIIEYMIILKFYPIGLIEFVQNMWNPINI